MQAAVHVPPGVLDAFAECLAAPLLVRLDCLFFPRNSGSSLSPYQSRCGLRTCFTSMPVTHLDLTFIEGERLRARLRGGSPVKTALPCGGSPRRPPTQRTPSRGDWEPQGSSLVNRAQGQEGWHGSPRCPPLNPGLFPGRLGPTWGQIGRDGVLREGASFLM